MARQDNMWLVDGVMQYGFDECTCMNGLVAGYKTCPDCKGTMRGKRGGKNGCKTCYGGKVHDFVNKVTCQGCNGTYQRKASRYSQLPKDIFRSLRFEVGKHTGNQDFNQAYLGAGYITTVTDYGRSAGMTDEQLIAEVREDKGWLQALNVLDKDERICKAVVISRNSNGYSAKARF